MKRRSIIQIVLILAANIGLAACSEDDSTVSSISGGNESKPGGTGSEETTGKCDNSCRTETRVCSLDGNSMICGDFDGDGCSEWKTVECTTGQTCVNGLCKDDSAPAPEEGCKEDCEEESCTNECETENQYECVTTADGKSATRVCSNVDADPCLEWSEPTVCGDGLVCKDGKCGCVDECSGTGAAECSGNGYRICADSNLDGCLEWSGVTACSEGCDKGVCTCNNECSEGAKTCSGAGYKTCTKNANGCYKWSAVVTCENGCSDGACKSAEIMEPTRYPGDQVLSPITAYVVQSMKTIAAKNSSRNSVSFMKVGDSHMYSGSVFMYCFSKTGSKSGMDLNGETSLQGVIDAFQSSSFNAFSRDSVSAVLGKTAYWAVSGGYIEQEMSAANPRFGFYGYGTNDMGWFGYEKPSGSASGYYATLQWYYRYSLKAIKTMINGGVIPMIIGTGVRTDKPTVANNGLLPIHWVKTFDAVGRGIAEAYQIPYYNLQLSQQTLSGYGLGSDGIHHKSSGKGCTFTSTGLQAGANTRNHHAIQMLDKAWRTVIKGESAPDKIIPYEGDGSKATPWNITSLPFTHSANTKKGSYNFSSYSCNTSANEGGPEFYYKITLTSTKKVRAFALSADNVDVDIHLKTSLNDNACKARGDKWIEASLTAGTYYFVVDTYASDSNAGEYLFGIVECDGDDSYCGSTTTGG